MRYSERSAGCLWIAPVCPSTWEPSAVAKFAVILPAAGRSSRFADKNYKKPFAPLGGRAVWLHSAERFLIAPTWCS